MPMQMKKLRRLLRQLGVTEDTSRGHGSHTFFQRTTSSGDVGYPIPTHSKDVLDCYVKGVWRALKIGEIKSFDDFVNER